MAALLIRCRSDPIPVQMIILAIEAGRRKARGARAQQSPVDLVALEMHRDGGLVLGLGLRALAHCPHASPWSHGESVLSFNEPRFN